MSKSFVLLAVLATFAITAPSEAARDWWQGWSRPGTTLAKPEPKTHLELLVFEIEDCLYCDVFRRNVGARYQAAAHAQRAPLRYVDINKVDTDALALKGAVRMVPTVILMKDGKEVDRIDGYVGPDNFFAMLTSLLDRVTDDE